MMHDVRLSIMRDNEQKLVNGIVIDDDRIEGGEE